MNKLPLFKILTINLIIFWPSAYLNASHDATPPSQSRTRSTVDRATQTSPLFSYRTIALSAPDNGTGRIATSPRLPEPVHAAGSESPEPSATAVIACFVLIKIIRAYLE